MVSVKLDAFLANSLSRDERPEGMTDTQWIEYRKLMPGGKTSEIGSWPRELLDSFSGTPTLTIGTCRGHVAKWIMEK